MRYSIVMLLALSLASYATHTIHAFQEPDKRLVNLEREKDKLKRPLDPVDRTKTQIKISELLLALTGDAIKSGDLKIMAERLDAYMSAIQDAHTTMMKTGRDAHKKPGGFRDLEIALRRQTNRLKDIGGTLTLDDRGPVEKARDEASRIREDLLKALFGSQNGSPN